MRRNEICVLIKLCENTKQIFPMLGIVFEKAVLKFVDCYQSIDMIAAFLRPWKLCMMTFARMVGSATEVDKQRVTT
jgi:hypothetical protein